MLANVRKLALWLSFCCVSVLYSLPSFAEQAPYQGNVQRIPGFIRAAFFDTGGEGVAYHDSTVANEPGALRPSEGVDVFETNYFGTTYAVGWVTPGEWIEHTVQVTHANYYDLYLTFASYGGGGTMHIEFDGVDKTGPIQIPDSGDWEAWRTTIVKNRIQLNGGTYVMRVVFDQGNPDGWLANIYGLEFLTEGERQHPYLNHTHLLPGKIEAEWYDNRGNYPNYVGGSENVTYYDTTPENEGGALRNDGVDIFASSSASRGHAVGWVKPGEWLEYSVHSAGKDIEIRYASLGDGGTMHIEINGSDRTGPIALPDTGGWDSWRTITIPTFGIASGVMRLVFDTAGPSGWLANIDYILVTQPLFLAPYEAPSYEHPYRRPLPSVPGYVQAEHFARGGEGVGYHDSSVENEPYEQQILSMRPYEGVDIEWTSDTNSEVWSQFDVGWITPGEWLAYVLSVTQDGVYTLKIRHASDGPGGTMHIEIDGEDVTGPIMLPDTGGWQQWQTLSVPNIEFTVGSSTWKTMRVVFDEGHNGWLANINWFGFVEQ